MAVPGRRTVSIISSISLGILTLSVFLAGRNNGPISTVSRFNLAILRRSPRLMATVCRQDPNSASVQYLAGQLSRSINSETPIYYGLGEKSRGMATVTATYVLGKNNRIYIPYVVKKSDGVWLVDCDATLSRLVNALSP